jgi:flagellar hook assembly protein FlgD
MRVYRGRGGSLVGSVDLARRSAVRLTIRRASDGGVVRRLHPAGRQPPGTLWFRWDGRGDGGSVVPSGTYVVRAQATNEIGRISLERAVRVSLRPRPA